MRTSFKERYTADAAIAGWVSLLQLLQTAQFFFFFIRLQSIGTASCKCHPKTGFFMHLFVCLMPDWYPALFLLCTACVYWCNIVNFIMLHQYTMTYQTVCGISIYVHQSSSSTSCLHKLQSQGSTHLTLTSLPHLLNVIHDNNRHNSKSWGPLVAYHAPIW